jgi:hypothetical protein
MNKPRSKVEFGDFQTPASLARAVCGLLLQRGVKPASIIEPNCGRGNFVLASLETFKSATSVIAADINPEHIASLRRALEGHSWLADIETFCGDFYETAWLEILKDLGEPFLIIGNPPWVTNAGLGVIGGSNLPQKSNFQRHAGLDAITGKSNFDISEWMLIRESEWLNGRTGTLAMLCKRAVARKVLLHAWKNSMQLCGAGVYPIDARNHFNAAVESCLLVCDFSPGSQSKECVVHRSLSHGPGGTAFGLRDGRLVADVLAYERHKRLAARAEAHKWRSGIKHDCAEVMELSREGTIYRNGLGERVELEGSYLYPMLKSSKLANGSETEADQWMIVTQQHIGERTEQIRNVAPKTWKYLCNHAERFERRASVIYKGKPRFSVFGVGEYTFVPWKVAISGLYKKLEFRVVGPKCEKPVVLDDTCYFLPCETQHEAEVACALLNSATAKEFYNALIFWDAKRPLTAAILGSLDLDTLASELGVDATPLSRKERLDFHQHPLRLS